MVKVAIVIGKMNSGGKKNLVMEYYRHIDRTVVQFDFICDSDSQAIPEDEIKCLGGRVYLIPPYQNIFANMAALKRLFKENKYIIVHSWNSTMNLFSLKVAKDVGIPIRISESLSMAHKDDWKTIIKRILLPFSKLYATHYMSCGELCGRWQFGNKLFDSGKVDVFKTVIDTDFNKYDPVVRKRTRAQFGWENNIVIGHIGRFTRQKNSVFLIDIFASISKKEPKAVMCLIGDGELKEEMFRKINKMKLSEKIFYLGRREDIQQFYNAMDCFVLPSLYEGLPVVGLEAESCGLPMFFSSEITKEANACELGHFIPLSASSEIWADEILKACKDNMPYRKSHDNEVSNAGFDSKIEAIRLQEYYLSAVESYKKND
ncbi:glycosyltransferase [Succinivibrio dextrinosolvens]|uniref:glycosyltransferase n=1 Tax=Succinivibrio dextrinosolvens TaxID=83771 RepID=UPI0019220602|nr:glycosyltransferase [Succinivibrio dextrinosolvens]